MRINIRLFGLYAFSLVIMYLAAAYFGDFLQILFIFFCIYPVLSFFSLLVWFIGIDCEQSFDTNHPVKGQEVDFRLRLINRSFLPIPALHVRFKTVSPSMQTQLRDFSNSIHANNSVNRAFRIKCPYRGEYTVGVRELSVSDFFQLFSLRKRIKPDTFTVYPRVLSLQKFAPIVSDVDGTGRYASSGIMPDPTLFQQLREYRDGDSIRHIYWKKYANTGKPYLKEFEKSRKAGVRIYFDLRRRSRHGIDPLEQEDVSVETLVALVKFFLERRVHTTVIAPGWKHRQFEGYDISSFEGFYRSTASMHFSSTPSPVPLFVSDKATGQMESQAALFVTHLFDPEILSLRADSPDEQSVLIMNTSCYSEKDRIEIDGTLLRARDQGALIIPIESANSIADDLERGS